MLNLSEFMIDSDEDSDDAASPPPPPPAPVQLRAPTPDSPTPQAPALQHNFNEVNEEPVLHQVPSAPSDPPAQPTPPASVHSHASSTPFEPAKPAPAVERTPRSWRGSRHSNLSHSAAVPPEPHSSAQATPPVLSAPTPEPSYSRTSDIHDLLHSDARRRATEASEREELQSLESRGLHGAGGASASALHVAASEAGSDKPHKKKFNKELFERLSKPLAVHVKYEERRRKEEEEKAAAQQAEAQSKQAVLLPVAEANWRVNRGRFQLSDLVAHNDQYLAA